MNRPIRVLIVDDSALVRMSLTEIFEGDDAGFEVMGTASDPFHAARLLRSEVPDVIVLDIEMPKMDGVTFLRKLMQQHPIPTVICSSLAKDGAAVTLHALAAGAVDVITKPDLSTRAFFEESKERIRDVVRAAASAKVRTRSQSPSNSPLRTASKAPPPLHHLTETTDRVIAIGASTGGTEAIYEVLGGLDAHCPGIVIVQHMPAGFTNSFAKRLADHCPLHVKEAEDGDTLLSGQALIAPGDHHLEIRRSGAKYVAVIQKAPAVNRHRPSVDVLFHSVARFAGKNAVGVILTGMGADGAAGLKAMRDQGAATIAQDEASSVVFGMPREAIRLGGAAEVASLESIPKRLLAWSRHPHLKVGS